MDKTYNDLMDIVNRTKKIDGESTPRPKRIIKQEPDNREDVDSEPAILKKASLFEGRDAINKYLSSQKTKAEEKKKSATTKSKSTTKKKTTKSSTKKTTKKSTPAKAKGLSKNELKEKKAKENAKKISDKLQLISKKVVHPKKSEPKLDMNDPKNVELYNALKETLFAGGTDISDYVNNGISAKKLNELFTQKKARKITDEITREQQEYEKLFTGSFAGLGENEDNNTMTDAKLQEYLARSENKDNAESENTNEDTAIENTSNESEAHENSENSTNDVENVARANRPNRFDVDLEEIKDRDKEFDEKIADYYKRKQEKINEYNKTLIDEPVEENKNTDEDMSSVYADIFSGDIEKRSDVVDSEPEVEEKEEEPKEKDFQTLYKELNDEDYDYDDDHRFVTPESERIDGEVYVSDNDEKENENSENETSNTNDNSFESDTNDGSEKVTSESDIKQTLVDTDMYDGEVYDQSQDDVYNLDDSDSLDDYVISSNVPVEENNGDEDNTMVMNVNDLPENKINYLDEDIDEDKGERIIDGDAISKQEFYNEMARLQENIVNELKGIKPEEVKPEITSNATLDKALDIIGQLTQNQNKEKYNDDKAEKVANDLIENIEKDMRLSELMSDDTEDEKVEKSAENAQTETKDIVKDTAEENTLVEDEKYKDINLLNKDVALNDSDLEYIVNSENEKKEKSEYFYLSEEDKSKRAEMESSAPSDDGKEMGDINLNKDIANANTVSEKGDVSTTPKPDDMETIYTIFGMQKKKVEKMENEIKVLYVASECQPFIATGGLGDVAGSLPKAIAKIGGVDIRVILPLYGKIKNEYADRLEYICNFTVHLSWRQEYCGLFKYSANGVTYYFVDNERYFNRETPYGYYDDGERFAYFCKAVVECLPYINFFPEIIHCNDWQSSLVSTYVKTGNWSDFRYYKIKNIYTIHNVEYQGIYGMENLKDLFGIDNRFKNDMEYNGDINLTKAAIQFSDKFTTVSNSYCDNLKQPYCSRGLHHIIIRNEYKLSGILNGIDYDFYNPKTDRTIYKNFDVDSIENKVYNKKIWQDELGLPVDGKTPMLAVVSRLVSHKGIDLLTKILEDVLTQDIQLVVVGTGDQRFIDYFRYLENKYPTKVRALVDKYSIENARKAYASSDIFLMPSKIEPCGISQMIASRYGSIPVVREVGGLKDTIKDFGCEGGGNGYTFANYNPQDLLNQIKRAINDYRDENEWKKKMQKVMTTDFSWSQSAGKYIDLYKSLVD